MPISQLSVPLRIATASLLLVATVCQAQELVLEVEVMEGSPALELPGPAGNRVRYALVHHKHPQDQASFAAWLQQHSGAKVAFETPDGAAHDALLRRLDHCFGRGLLLYTDPVELKAKGVMRLRLGTTR